MSKISDFLLETEEKPRVAVLVSKAALQFLHGMASHGAS